MKTTLKIAILFILGSYQVSAQQDAMYSQYMFNTLAVNPAYAGSREVLSISALARLQWQGMEGAPTSQTMSLDMPVTAKKVGLGLQVFSDKLGLMSNTGAYISYAYRIKFERSTLALGLQGGLVNFTADYSKAILSRNQSGTSTDRAFQSDVSAIIPSAGAGIYLSSDKYYVGASLPNIYNTQASMNAEVKVNKYDHLFLMAGYLVSFNDEIKLKPSMLLKAVKGAPIELDLNANLWLNDRVAIGVSYRTGDAAVAMAEIQVSNTLKVGYAYDYSLTALSQYNCGSHELMLRYEFGYGKSKMVTPRYF